MMKTMVLSKRIELDGAPNTRDLGGIITADGRKIKQGLLFRSGDLSALSDSDIKKLESFKFNLVVDLRTETERSKNPDKPISGARVLNLQVVDEEILGITRNGDNSVDDLIEILKDESFDIISFMSKMYETIINSKAAAEAYSKFFKGILANDTGAVLWHCSAGKDRAGMAAAFILMALGVSRETIIEDYLLTNQFAGKKLLEIIKLKTDDADVVKKADIMLSVHRDYIESVYHVIDERGGEARFLSECLGVADSEIQTLKRRYLE